MRRAKIEQRRAAKARRRVRRKRNRSATYQEARDRQHMARVVLGQHNLSDLSRRARVVAKNQSDGKRRKLPKLTHYRGDIPSSRITELLGSR